MKPFFISALFLLSLNSYASANNQCSASTPQGMQACLSGIQAVTAGPNIYADCSPIKSECEDKIKNMTADGVVNITFAQGYMDEAGKSDNVLSGYEANTMINNLTAPCPLVIGGQNVGKPEEIAAGCGHKQEVSRACGFKRTDDPEVLIKHHTINGKLVAISARIMNSAISGSASENNKTNMKFIEQKYCAGAKSKQACVEKHKSLSTANMLKKCTPGDETRFQLCRSEFVKRRFEASIVRGDEIVLYNGHARGGGGPDFYPAKTLPNGRVDYPNYRKYREGHNFETQALKRSVANGKEPVLYGSYSCKGTEVFMDNGNFPEASPKTSYVLSKRIAYTEEALNAAMVTLDGTLNGQCGKVLNDSVERVSCAYNVKN